jgi:hypothetical protein
MIVDDVLGRYERGYVTRTIYVCRCFTVVRLLRQHFHQISSFSEAVGTRVCAIQKSSGLASECR